MDVQKTTRRWLPGRQTLSRTDPAARTEVPDAAAGSDMAEADGELYDPVYDWFDLRRPAEDLDAPSPRRG